MYLPCFWSSAEVKGLDSAWDVKFMQQFFPLSIINYYDII